MLFLLWLVVSLGVACAGYRDMRKTVTFSVGESLVLAIFFGLIWPLPLGQCFYYWIDRNIRE